MIEGSNEAVTRTPTARIAPRTKGANNPNGVLNSMLERERNRYDRDGEQRD